MQIQPDKIKHFIAGLLLFAVGAIVQGPVMGMIVCAVGGIGKELFDHVSRRGTPEAADAFATILGGVAGLLLHFAMLGWV